MSQLGRLRFINILKYLYNNKVPVRTYKFCIKTNPSVYTSLINNSNIFLKTNLETYRYKHSKKDKKQQDLTESDEEENADDLEDEVQDKQTRLLTVKLNSLRADLVLKAGLGVARNKIEAMFYESKIRINGKKLLKKSAMLKVGDEIDIVKGTNIQNPDFLNVARVEILAATEKGDSLSVKLRRNRNLTIENYDEN